MSLLRTLQRLEHLEVLIFQPGLGGMFLCNLFNLADSAVDKSNIDDYWRGSMYNIVAGKMQHEMNPTFQSTKVFFDGLHETCSDEQIDLWLVDIELRLRVTTQEFWKLETYDTWLRDPSAVVKHRTIYCPEHAPGRLQGTVTSKTLDRIALRAAKQGISVRFVIATVYDRQNMLWAQERENEMVHKVSAPVWMERQTTQYQEGLNSQHATELCLDSFLGGDVDSLLSAMSRIMVGHMQDPQLIRHRAQEFLRHKRFAAC